LPAGDAADFYAGWFGDGHLVHVSGYIE
jgi:hypothetical protein